MSQEWSGHWARLGDPSFDDGFTLPLNTPIACLARSPDHMDLFAVGKDSAVYTTFFDRLQNPLDPNGEWSGQWIRLGDPSFGDGFTLPLNTPIACLARTADRMDLFAVGKDGAVYSTFFDFNFFGGWTGHWFRIGDPSFSDGFTLPLNTPIACLARSPDRMDLFAVGKDGAVYSTFSDRPQNPFDPNGEWSGHWFRLGDPSFGDGFTLPLNTPIACLARSPDHMDLFAVGKDGAVYRTLWVSNGGWFGQWLRLGDPSFGDGFTLPLSTPIACLARTADHMDLFAVGKDSAVYSTFSDFNGGWSGQWLRLGDPSFGDGFTLPLNTPIACLARTADHMDLFAVGIDSAVYSTFFDRLQTFFDPIGGWSGHWTRLGDPSFGDGFTLPLNTPIACLARTADHMDLFAVGKDSAVYSTTFFDSDPGG